MAELLLGKPVVDSMTEEMLPRVQALSDQRIVPTLAIVRMGKNPDDLSYERTAIKRADTLGIFVRPYVLDVRARPEVVEAMLQSINADRTVDGCLILRPLPETMDEDALCNIVDPIKDVDGITRTSLVSLFTDKNEGFPPCTASACIRMLDFYGIPIEGKHAVVIGRSLVVGKPVSMLLLRRNATVTMCHSKTENLAELTRAADIVICATGKPKAFGAEYFSPGQTVLDVGINFDEEGNLCGDVDFDEVEPIVGAITPVPRGIGTVTTSETMEHVITAAERAAEA